MKNANSSKGFEIQLAYIHGSIDQQIKGYASDLGISHQLLAARLAHLLHPGGQGSEDQMPLVREGARGRAAMVKVEMAGDARDGLSAAAPGEGRISRITPAGRRKLSIAMKQRWAERRRKASKGTGTPPKMSDRRWRNADGTLMNAAERHAEQERRQASRRAA